jgi:stress-induced morphogen
MTRMLKILNESKMPISQDHVERKLAESLEPVFLRVEDFSDGCGSKYNVFVVSKKFEGQSLINRQRYNVNNSFV